MARKHAPFSGTYQVGTKAHYTSGAPHWAYDYQCPPGTPLYAVRDGIILDCNDGQPDNPPKRWAGMSSNWILLGYRNLLGQKRTVYYQHLRCGSVQVVKGQKIRAGDLIAASGNSGNSTGPHLHIHAMKGWRSRDDRYANMRPETRVFPPDLVWAKGTL